MSGAPAISSARDNRIHRLTRGVALLIIPFLLAAAVILLLLSDQTARWSAWEIRSPLMAAFMGAGYLGGAYFFWRTLVGARWHRLAAGYPAIALFTATMLVATLLHWERFDKRHWPFQVWLLLYVVTPPLLLWVWRRNGATDPGRRESGDPIVPLFVRWLTAISGAVVLAASLVTLVAPAPAIGAWPWPLTPPTARALAGWHALLGAGGLLLARQRHWSAWRTPLETIAIWQVLFLLAAIVHRADFHDGLWNWYLIYAGGGLLGIVTVYVWLEMRGRQTAVSP